MQTKVYDYLHKDAIYIRTEVFMKEQGFENEFDEIEEQCMHLVIYDKDTPIGTCRLYRQDDNRYVIGRIAVLSNYRSIGIGKVIVEKAEEYIKKIGGIEITLSAQVRVQGFYKKMGYICEGAPYLDEYCPHIVMKKSL